MPFNRCSRNSNVLKDGQISANYYELASVLARRTSPYQKTPSMQRFKTVFNIRKIKRLELLKVVIENST